MSRTYRGYQKRDGKKVGKPTRSYKKMTSRIRRAQCKQALREGREPVMHKNSDYYDYN